MKAIRIHQPWASLITLGEKRFETRSWHPQYRGRILIHASKTFNPLEQDLCHQHPFIETLNAHGIEFVNQLPTGAIIAIATLADCHLVDELVEKLSPNERAFGDFRSGRYAWLLQEITPLVIPVFYRGRQSIFEIPAEAETRTGLELFCNPSRVDGYGALAIRGLLVLDSAHQRTSHRNPRLMSSTPVGVSTGRDDH